MRYNFFIYLGRGIKKFFFRVFVIWAVIFALAQSFTGDDPLQWAIGHVDLQEVTAPANSPQQPESGEHVLTLSLVNRASCPEAYVLVNGRIAGSFDRDSVTIPVQQGDIIEMDVSYYKDAVQVKIAAVSEEIIKPVKGEKIKARGNIVKVGKVRLE